MPIATPAQYAAMIDAAQQGSYAYPAINVTSVVTINAALKAFSEKESDGIIQISIGGGKFASGLNVGNPALGAIVLAEAAHRLAAEYDVLIGLHTDHCQAGVEHPKVRAQMEAAAAELGCNLTDDLKLSEELLDTPEKKEQYGWVNRVPAGNDAGTFLEPLIRETARRREAGLPNLFQSHMLDASVLPLDLNMELSKDLLASCAANEIILEVEAGVVGGEEDGMDHSGLPDEKLYTTPDDMLRVYETLNGVGRYLFAATFGNVHGSYKPGAVKLRPDILKSGQEAVIAKYGKQAEFDLVFHGGSGTPEEQLRETLEYGVVKMNIDTDTQYAFTRPIVDHVMKNYDGVLKVDGEIGNKKVYDPRSYLKSAEKSTAARLAEACDDLFSSGKSIAGTV